MTPPLPLEKGSLWHLISFDEGVYNREWDLTVFEILFETPVFLQRKREREIQTVALQIRKTTISPLKSWFQNLDLPPLPFFTKKDLYTRSNTVRKISMPKFHWNFPLWVVSVFNQWQVISCHNVTSHTFLFNEMESLQHIVEETRMFYSSL